MAAKQPPFTDNPSLLWLTAIITFLLLLGWRQPGRRLFPSWQGQSRKSAVFRMSVPLDAWAVLKLNHGLQLWRSKDIASANRYIIVSSGPGPSFSHECWPQAFDEPCFRASLIWPVQSRFTEKLGHQQNSKLAFIYHCFDRQMRLAFMNRSADWCKFDQSSNARQWKRMAFSSAGTMTLKNGITANCVDGEQKIIDEITTVQSVLILLSFFRQTISLNLLYLEWFTTGCGNCS